MTRRFRDARSRPKPHRWDREDDEARLRGCSFVDLRLDSHASPCEPDTRTLEDARSHGGTLKESRLGALETSSTLVTPSVDARAVPCTTTTRTTSHGSVRYDRAFLVSVVLNVTFVVVEFTYGLVSHSMALVADAGHNLSDVLGLVVAWGASWIARRKPSKLRTYGFRRATILAAIANGALLFFVTGGVMWESLQRLLEPPSIEGRTVIVVAVVGVVINGASALLFRRGKNRDLNVRGAFLHLAADAVVSLGVVITGVILLCTQWNILDPMVSLVLSVVIVLSAWYLLRKSVNLALDAVPEGIDVDAVQAYLDTLPGVIEVHDLHIWAMSTTENALTAHLVMNTGACEPRFLGDVCKTLHERFGIEHSTLQVEAPGAPDPCRLAPEGTL